MSSAIGALVITRDEEQALEDCLKSLTFCDEIVVVDSFSTDATVEIARRFADLVVQRDFVDFGNQKDFGLSLLGTEWALVVDADERVSAALADEIRTRVDAGMHDGYWLYRRNRFFGREIRGAGWQRDRVLRLFRRHGAHHPDRLVHEEVALAPGARIAACTERLDHFSYDDWPSTFGRLLSYTSRGAAERHRRGHRGSGWRMGTKPLGRFLRQYVAQGGWKDGLHGYVLCVWSAIGVFVREAKLAAEETGIPSAPSGPVRVEVVHDTRDARETSNREATREGDSA